MGGPSIVSLKFAFWLVCVTFLLHCWLIPTAVTEMRAHHYRQKSGIRLSRLLKGEPYVPTTVSKRFRGLKCAHKCFSSNCRAFNVDLPTGECELFYTESDGIFVNDANSSYYWTIPVPQCGEMAVEHGQTVAAGVKDLEAVNVICDAGYIANPAPQAICNNGVFNTVTCVHMRTCERLTVTNGDDILGAEHNQTVNISCNVDFKAAANVVCRDGVFFSLDSDQPIYTVDCYPLSCAELLVANGTSIATVTPNGDVVQIECNVGLHSYYTNATCVDGFFVPSRVLCGDYPSPSDAASFAYHGQFLKAFDNPLLSFASARDVCEAKGGIMATVLSAHLLQIMKPIIPHVTPESRQTLVGLKKKPLQIGGWQWINSATGDVIDIDTGNSVAVVWIPIVQTQNDSYAVTYHAVIYRNDNIGHEWQPFGYGMNLAGDSGSQHYQQTVLCQIGYPWYEFSVVATGSRMVSPQEWMVVGVDVVNCTNTCIQSAFCRAFSYSSVLSDCRHHSIPPDDPEAVVVGDEKYDIYA